MSTAACGINCNVCRLNLLGICSTCGSGIDRDGLRKMAAQERILGQPCPILACAVKNHIEYCLRDCDRFPCIEFSSGPYPFSRGYLSMQERRWKERAAVVRGPSGSTVEVPAEYWEDLKEKDIKRLSEDAVAINHPPMGLILPFLKEFLLVDIKNHCLFWYDKGQLERVKDTLLELLCLVYLLNVGPQSIADKIVSANELKTAHFFRGPHELKVRPVLERYGNDLEGFRRVAERVGGDALNLADVSYSLRMFPKIPLYYLLWEGDQEFQSTLSVLFDSSIEHHLAADAIWGLVNLASDILLIGDIKAAFQRGHEV